MNDRTLAPLLHVNIAAVERDTRIGKDTLRVWERRYGFPQPVRDSHGERLYPADQVEKLRIIKRLLDTGFRPGQVVALDVTELQQMGSGEPDTAGLPDVGRGESADTEIARLMDIVRRHDPAQLRRVLSQALLRHGLGHFVTQVAVPLNREIGQSWAQGELQIFEEHFCSEVLETTLRAALAGTPYPASAPASHPRVVLSTLSGEPHSLGLLMAEALFSVDGCACMNLGRQTPLQDVYAAALAYRAHIVAISFSAAGHAHHAAEALGELRALLPESVEIWAGSPHATLHRRGVPGVLLLSSLDQIGPEVQRWRDTPR